MKRTMGILVFLAVLTCGAFAQNYKIKQVVTMSGQKIESTVYVKNSRQRTESGGFMGMGGDVADVQQCDLKRNIKISDTKKLYYIEPFASDSNDAATTDKSSATNQKSSKTVKGGTVTMIYNITDTGERKQMFGLTARHLKTTMTMQASADACTDADMKMETDGWYVDLPQFSCPVQMPKNPMMQMGGAGGGCQDKMIVKQTGSGKLGFPLQETRTMKMGDDEDMPTVTQMIETIEFSKAPLEDKLFDIPAGYTLANSSQQLYGDRKSMSQTMMQNSSRNDSDDAPKTTSVKSNSSMNNSSINLQMRVNKKKAGTIRVGVYVPTNKGGDAISTTNMQMYLVGKLTGANVEAVNVTSEADARAANCDYVLSSDFSKLKVSTASKIGGFLGKVTSTDTSGAKTYEAQVDFKLISLADGKTAFQNKAANKSETDVDRAAENVLAQEAQSILGAIVK